MYFDARRLRPNHHLSRPHALRRPALPAFTLSLALPLLWPTATPLAPYLLSSPRFSSPSSLSSLSHRHASHALQTAGGAYYAAHVPRTTHKSRDLQTFEELFEAQSHIKTKKIIKVSRNGPERCADLPFYRPSKRASARRPKKSPVDSRSFYRAASVATAARMTTSSSFIG